MLGVRKVRKQSTRERDYALDEKVVEFFIMPSKALKTLRKELDKLVQREASATLLFRHGYISGYELGKKLGVMLGLERLGRELPELWAEVGLGRMVDVYMDNGSISVTLRESPEIRPSKSVPYCDFTRGYLAGFVSAITGRRFMGIEQECASQNGDRCRFLLSPAGAEEGGDEGA